MRISHALALALLGATSPAQELVTDLDPGTLSFTYSTLPRGLVAAGTQVFFAASHPDFGIELWTFGPSTADRPRMLADIAPGRQNGWPQYLTAWNGRLFFTAVDPEHGLELWVSDGTEAGTRRVADIAPGPTSSFPSQLVPTPFGLFFTAVTVATGCEPWITDGTAAGTRMLRDVNPGSGSGAPGGAGSAALHGGRVYFQGFEPATGGELWATDGTAAGTIMVADVAPGAASLWPLSMVSSPSGLFFRAHVSTASGRLWVSDGTAAGTRPVLPATGQVLDVPADQIAPLGPQVVFRGRENITTERMWRSDGTPAGTVPCSAEGSAGVPYAVGPRVLYFTKSGSQLLLWAVPRVSGNAALVATIGLPSPSTAPQAMKVVDGRLWFSLETSGSGTEPWVSDGTSGGTRQVGDLRPGPTGSVARDFVAFPGLLGHVLLVAGEPSREDELWLSDGTPGGTQRIATVQVATPASSSPTELARCGPRLLFTAAPRSTGLEPYTAQPGDTARLLADLNPGSGSSNARLLGLAGERALVQAAIDGDRVRVVLSTDGTPSGTSILLPPVLGTQLFPVASLDARTVFLLLTDRLTLWSSDGTPSGTEVLQDLGTSFIPALGGVGYSARIGPDAVFALPQRPAGQHLLLARTRERGRRYERLWERAFPSGSNFQGLWGTGRSALAVTLTGQGTVHIYTDGTAAGTREVSSPVPGFVIGSVGDRFLFVSYPTAGSAQLHVSDPLMHGFQNLVSFQVPGGTSYLPAVFPSRDAEGRELAIFEGLDAASGAEPWITDGTSQGTRLLADLAPGTASSEPREFRVIGSRVVFSAYTLAHGREAFVTDGTTAGTRMLFDLAPGTVESEPREFTRVRTTVYFSAYHPLTGRELHAMPLLATGASLVEDVGQGCAGSAGVPVLGAVGEPARGNARFALDVAGARPSAPAAVFLGVGDARLAFGPCTLRVLPLASLPLVVGAGGSATLALPIPADPSVRGLEFSAQAAIADPAGAGLGTALTQALRMMVGD